ncbi:MAG: hypothetical protein ACOZQL_03045 [Myxococcota bacterium]
MRRLFPVVVLFSTAAFAQWVPVDGGFHNSVGSGGRIRAVELFAPTRSTDWFTVTDTGAPRTQLRFRMVGDAPPAQLDGGVLTWGARQLAPNGDFTLPPQTRLEFEPASGRKLEVQRPFGGGTLTMDVRGPERIELRLEGQCVEAAGAQPLSLDCGPFALRSPLLRRFNHVVSVIHLEPLDSMVSTGGGAIGRDAQQTIYQWSPNDSWAAPIAAPAPFDARRVNAATLWDPVRKQLVVFGGKRDDGTRLGDTLVWDGTSWSSPTLATSPPPRSDAAFAFDPLRGRAVLFGGLADDRTLLGDTWEWDGTTWQQLSPALSPSPRAQPGLVWDGTRNELLLFSGYAQSDSFTWNGTRWAELPQASMSLVSPPFAATWDPVSRLVVIVGRRGSSPYASAAWDGTTWFGLAGIAPLLIRSAIDSGGRVYAVAEGSVPDLVLNVGARTWVEYSMPILSGPGVPAADGGIRQLSRGLVRGWFEDPRGWGRWVQTGALPAEDFESAAEHEGQLFAIGMNDAGVANTWHLDDEGRVEQLASGPRGKLVAQSGALWLLGDRAAWTWDGGWNSMPWPALSVSDAVAARDGGFFILRRERQGEVSLLQVDTTGATTALFGKTTSMRSLIPMRGDLPFLLGSVGGSIGVNSWNEQDGGWLQEAQAIPFQEFTYATEVLGQDGRGRTFLSAKAPANDNTTFIWDPWRPNGAYCATGVQCTSGNCVDGRCCDSTCTCGACSTARGATEDGVCLQRPAEECAEPTNPEPPPVRQCSCGTAGWLALPLVLLLRRRSSSTA